MPPNRRSRPRWTPFRTVASERLGKAVRTTTPSAATSRPARTRCRAASTSTACASWSIAPMARPTSWGRWSCASSVRAWRRSGRPQRPQHQRWRGLHHIPRRWPSACWRPAPTSGSLSMATATGCCSWTAGPHPRRRRPAVRAGLRLAGQRSPARGPVVGTLMTNYRFERALGERGIGFVRAKVGDRHVHQQLLAHEGVLGGEASGHILCLDHCQHRRRYRQRVAGAGGAGASWHPPGGGVGRPGQGAAEDGERAHYDAGRKPAEADSVRAAPQAAEAAVARARARVPASFGHRAGGAGDRGSRRPRPGRCHPCRPCPTP